MVEGMKAAAPGATIRCHFHNTRNTGLANAYAAWRAGAEVLDAAVGGVGGCPFAPRATGNIPTEDTVYMLERMGLSTGYDLGRLVETAGWLSGVLGKELPGMVSRAGGFPAPAA
jgi:hydroxymethylglutaryl-CoA lyase